jgi:hypothetical protein
MDQFNEVEKGYTNLIKQLNDQAKAFKLLTKASLKMIDKINKQNEELTDYLFQDEKCNEHETDYSIKNETLYCIDKTGMPQLDTLQINDNSQILLLAEKQSFDATSPGQTPRITRIVKLKKHKLQCIFGLTCNNKQICSKSHDFPVKKIYRQCMYGNDCKRKEYCPFRHYDSSDVRKSFLNEPSHNRFQVRFAPY